MAIRTVVWNEHHHERTNPAVSAIYPDGIHTAIAALLKDEDDLEISTATQDQPEHGLAEERLSQTDVLIWWGHRRQADVEDEVVDRVVRRVWEGMGLVVLHSALLSKVFRRLTGAPCGLRWRDANERERVWVVNQRHPVAAGLPEYFEFAGEEMYGEPFGIPEPLETVFISWFEGGEVFRSGVTYRRGAGNIFFFRPGHETAPTFHQPIVGQVLRNAVRWAYNPAAPLVGSELPRNVPKSQSLEKIGG